MLVLTRNLQDAIRIGPEVRVKILGISGKRVMVGIEAPEDLRVSREDAGQEGGEHPDDREDLVEPLSVLVVEDTHMHARLITKALEKLRVNRVVVAPTGEEAVRILVRGRDPAEFRPNLVLLDLRLPGLSGFEVLQLMRSVAAFKTTPVVILTSSTLDADVERCIEGGANAVIAKSENYEEFRTSVRRIAEFWRRARRVG